MLPCLFQKERASVSPRLLGHLVRHSRPSETRFRSRGAPDVPTESIGGQTIGRLHRDAGGDQAMGLFDGRRWLRCAICAKTKSRLTSGTFERWHAYGSCPVDQIMGAPQVFLRSFGPPWNCYVRSPEMNPRRRLIHCYSPEMKMGTHRPSLVLMLNHVTRHYKYRSCPFHSFK